MFKMQAMTVTVVCSVVLFCNIVRANVFGLNNLSGWTYNQPLSDTGTPADLPDADTIHITSLGTNQSRSIFYNTPQQFAEFLVKFTYRAANASVFGCDYGATFTLQNSPDGRFAVGGTDFGLGYDGIRNSAAVSLQLQSNSSGYYTGGSVGSGSSVDPVNLISGNPINVTLSYNGNILSETLVDSVTAETYQRNIIVGDLTTPIGGPLAYVGFTASTTTGQCSGDAADQYISGFEFTVIPEPATLSLMLMAGLLLARGRRAQYELHSYVES